MPSHWKPLSNTPPFSVDTMLLLTDASVMCHEVDTSNWHRLVPDAKGNYVNGTWQAMTPMPANAPLSQGGPVDAPLYYASAVLKDGRVFVAGGEYNAGNKADLLTAEIYDPVADSWAVVAPPAWSNVGDAPSCVLPNGKVLLGDINSVQTAILDPTTKTWSPGGNKDDNSSEESWTLLPNHSILCAEVNNHPKAERYVIASNTWVSAGSVPAASDLVLNAPVSIEIGPAILMPDSRVFCIGASGHTALYDVKSGTWSPGPDVTDSSANLLLAFDAPAVLLPNGRVLFIVGPVVTSGPEAGWAGLPISFFEFDGTKLHSVLPPTNGNADITVTYNCRFLLLPTGQVLYSNCSSDLEIFTPRGAPHHHWRPHITHVSKSLRHGHSYRLRGRQLNGLSQANAYGDDAQMATNYPLVRLKHIGNKKVYFCRTFDHSTMAVATGKKIVHTHFHVSSAVPVGHYELTVVANGIHSKPVKVRVKP